MKPRSLMIGSLNNHIASKFKTLLGITAAEVQVKSQSDRIILNTNSRLTRSYNKKSYRILKRGRGRLRVNISYGSWGTHSKTQQNQAQRYHVRIRYSDVIMGPMASQIIGVWLARRRSKKALKVRVTGLCPWDSTVIGVFPAQKASNAENVSIWWCHLVLWTYPTMLKTQWVGYLCHHW